MKFKKTIIFTLFLMQLASTPYAAAKNNKDQLSDEIVKISRFGVTFQKPDSWFEPYSSIVVENIHKLDKDKEKISEILSTSNESMYIGSYYRHDPSKVAGVIPTINVLIRKSPHYDFSSFRKLIELTNQSASTVFNNYSLIKEVTETTISGKKVVYLSYEFDINTADGKKYHVNSTTYAIPFDKAFMQISMSEGVPIENSGLFSKFIKSLKIE